MRLREGSGVIGAWAMVIFRNRQVYAHWAATPGARGSMSIDTTGNTCVFADPEWRGKPPKDGFKEHKEKHVH